MTPWLIIRVGGVLLDSAVAALVLFARRPGSQTPSRDSVNLARVFLAVVATSVLFAIRIPLLSFWGLNLFGLIHLVYLDFVVTLPIVGLCVLIAGRRSMRSVRRLGVVALLGLPIGIYASFIEPFRLQTETATVRLPAERSGAEPIRIGVLADIQTDRITDYERRVVERLMAMQPDIIVLTGDFYHGTAEDWPEQLPLFRDLLNQLSAPGGIYAVEGNCDRPDELTQLLAKAVIKRLTNEIVRTSVNGRDVTIGGVEFPCDSPNARRTIDELGRAADKHDIRILLSHQPDAVALAQGRIDLVVSGHTHGGQVVLPLVGPLLTFSSMPRYICAGGLHDYGNSRIYTSRGVGCERGQAPRLRFLCPPEISLITLDN